MGGLFSKPKTPKEQPPVRMPTETDADIAAAAERRRQERAAAGGRDSTDLTGGALGGGANPSADNSLGS